MNSPGPRPVKLRIEVEKWPLKAPFRIAGHTMIDVLVVVVILEHDGYVGRGEAAGVYYLGDDTTAMVKGLEAIRSRIEAGIDRPSLQMLLPAGGARNALDCALWDLEAKLTGLHAWEMAGLKRPGPLVTTFTCGADEPEKMVEVARSYTHARAIKLKLTGQPVDARRVAAVRAAREDVWLGVDANQGLNRESFEKLLPALIDARVSLIEQPFPIGCESWLEGLQSSIPIAADESIQTLADLRRVANHVQVVNIKLDKCGGLTEGLAMARAATALGLDCMVGSMLGTSLSVVPAWLLGQLCSIVDLDSPVFLKTDRDITVGYAGGKVSASPGLWGGPGLASQKTRDP